MNDYQTYDATPVSTKSKTTTGLLAIFLGACGVDQFYLGKVGAGIASICIMVGCIVVAAIIGFVLGILSLFLIFPIFFAIPVGILCGACTWIWPIIRAVKAFKGKAVDAQGAIVIN